MTGWLWPFPDRDGETGPATRFAEDRRTAPLTFEVGNADCVFTECKHASGRDPEFPNLYTVWRFVECHPCAYHPAHCEDSSYRGAIRLTRGS